LCKVNMFFPIMVVVLGVVVVAAAAVVVVIIYNVFTTTNCKQILTSLGFHLYTSPTLDFIVGLQICTI
jgi:hypothetical protein